MDEEIREPEEKEEENKGGISSDLIRGHINTIILRTLYERDKYGYEIIEEIESKSHGQYTLKQPTLYSALKRLESQGYINAYWKTDEVSNGGRRKYYTLTDSGREITEKNQNEWEYSRTVIDSLISDKNFDFSQPAPTPVDFKILKSSTSRVPTVKDEEETKEMREVKYDEEKPTEATTQQQPVQATEQPVNEQPTAPAQPEQPVYQQAPAPAQPEQPVYQQAPAPVQPEQPVYQQAPTPVPEQPVYQQAPLPEQPIIQQTQPVYQQAPIQPNVQQVYSQPAQPTAEQILEERRIHENYLRLITEPVKDTRDETTPYSEKLNTDKLIYNNKPETERDYKNLLNNLFMRTVKPQPQQQPPAPQPEPEPQVNYEDAGAMASKDGLTINSSDYVVTKSRKSRYNRGNTLVKCSLIVAVIMLVEFALSFAFQKTLEVSIGYPIVILVLALAQLLIFLILTTTEFGKSTRRPTTHSYLSATIVLAIIMILIIFVTSLLLNVNFAEIHDIMAKIIIPSIVALNVPIFSILFYIFSK